jgi:hypothetical protein
MVYIKDQRFSPREGESGFATNLRDLIESTKPYRDSSVMFAAYTPPGENVISQWAPTLLIVALVGFLIL